MTEFDFEIQYVPGSQLKLVDTLSRKPYKDGDNGNIIPLLPKRDRLWDDEFDVAEARRTTDDEFWIEVMKKKFGEPIKKTPKPPQEKKPRNVGDVTLDSLDKLFSDFTVSALEEEGEALTLTVDNNDGFKYKKKKETAYLLTQPNPNKTIYAVHAPKTTHLLARTSKFIDTQLEVTIPPSKQGNVVPPPPKTLPSEHVSVVPHGLIAGTRPLCVHIRNNSNDDQYIHQGEIIAHLELKPAFVPFTCNETRTVSPSTSTACQETVHSVGGVITETSSSFPNTPITKIPGINSEIQYPKRGSKEETPEERRKRIAENKTMCEREHRPWPLLFGNPCSVCNPPKSVKQESIKKYCQPMPKPEQDVEIIDITESDPCVVYVNTEETKPDIGDALNLELILQDREEDGYQEEIDKAVADLAGTLEPDPFRQLLNVAPVEKEEKPMELAEEGNAKLSEEINHERKIEERIERLQMERLQELETTISSAELSKRVLNDSEVVKYMRNVKYTEPDVPLNRQFLSWLSMKQSEDEACILLMKVINKEIKGKNKKLKKSEIESHIRGYKMQLTKDKGMNPKRVAQINPRKGRERIKQQIKNYTCLKRLYDKGYIRPEAPIMMNQRRAIIPLDAQETVIQAAHHGAGTFHLGTERTHKVLSRWVYFPRMVSTIGSYIKNCHQCIVGKRLAVRTSPGLGQTSSWPHKP